MEGAWELDKYKFLNMMERTWEKRPDMDWYVFTEADTYVVWPSLVTWLREFAPKGEAYIGSVAMINDHPFAHGGSGYVISGAMMKKMVGNIPGIAARYDERAMSECCGDLLLSLAVHEAGGKVQQAHPMFNGEKPSTLPYGPGHWCEPLLTMHHMNPEEVSMVWQYEQTRTNKTVSLPLYPLPSRAACEANFGLRKLFRSRISTRRSWHPIWCPSEAHGTTCLMMCVT